jgi:CheY-like chemotaxis protein/nitrogen-specific signal transduction histidine kinase
MRSRVVEDLHALETAHREVAAGRRELEERALELARSNRDLEQFAYVASHDLQEPLRKVAAFCQLLSERYHEELDEKGQQYIDFAVDGAKRMQSLVNDLLSFSRVGRNHDQWTDVALDAAVRVALSNLEARIESSGASVTFPETLPMVRGDSTLLAALFQNLIGNAIKFQGDDPPVVDVTCVRREALWELRVTDNGIGIEPQYAARVFVIFQRLHARDRYEGTGIGWALCRKIVEFHGGEITVAPIPGPGTTIAFTLPALPPTPRSPMPDARLEPVKILLVEDDAGDVVITTEALAQSKLLHELHTVGDGEAALDFLHRRAAHEDAVRPDLVLLDLNLSRLDGREVLASVKADPDLRRIPIVVLSTSEAEEDIARSYDLHANAYVSKPVDFNAFVHAVRQIDDFFLTVVRLPRASA